MLHKAWSYIEEVPYCFWRSSVTFLGHGSKNRRIWPRLGVSGLSFSNLNSPMGTKWCTKLEEAYKRCPIVFQGHPSNFKVARLLKSLNLTQIGRFNGLELQFEFTNGYEMMHKAWSSIEEVPYFFFQGHPWNFLVIRLKKIVEFDPDWTFPDCNSSLNSAMATKCWSKLEVA